MRSRYSPTPQKDLQILEKEQKPHHTWLILYHIPIVIHRLPPSTFLPSHKTGKKVTAEVNLHPRQISSTQQGENSLDYQILCISFRHLIASESYHLICFASFTTQKASFKFVNMPGSDLLLDFKSTASPSDSDLQEEVQEQAQAEPQEQTQEHAQQALDETEKITLDVGGREYVSSAGTLIKSNYFAYLRTGQQPEGTRFIDADPALFSHILRYLRRGVLPVFYDQHKGHHHLMYVALLAEARFFQVDRLVEWLEKKEYLGTVAVKHSVDTRLGSSNFLTTESPDTEIQVRPLMKRTKVHVCARGLEVHYNRKDLCGRACKEAQAERPVQPDDIDVLHLTVHTKKTIFNTDACLS